MARPNTRAHITACKNRLHNTPQGVLDKITNLAGPVAGAILASMAAGLDKQFRDELATGAAITRGLADPVFVVRLPCLTSVDNNTLLDQEANARTNGGYTVNSPQYMESTVSMYIQPGDITTSRFSGRYNATSARERSYLAGRNEFAQALIADGHPASQRLRESFGIQ